MATDREAAWDALHAATPPGWYRRRVRFVERHAWKVFAGLSVLIILFGVGDVTALRRGDRWAWYALWAWPLRILLVYLLFWMTHPDLSVGIPVPLISGTVLLVIIVLTLGLSCRRYLRPA